MVVTVWGSTFVLTKQAFTEVAPLAFAGVRFVGIAALAVAVLAASARAGKAQWRVARGDLPRFIAAGVCGYTFYQLGFVLGLERTSPFSSALLISTVPLFTIMLLTLLGERPPVQQWLGVGVALVGMAIFLSDKLGAPGSLLGDALSLGSAISFASYGVINRPLVQRYPVATYTAYTVLAGALPLVLLALPASLAQDWRAVSIGTWLVVLYMIVLPVYVAYIVWNWGIVQRGAAAASSFSLLTPLATAAMAIVAFDEGFTVPKLIGAGLVLAGLLALQQRAARVPTMLARE